jgi:restriction system protein
MQIDILSILRDVFILFITQFWYLSLFLIAIILFKIYKYQQLSKAGLFDIDKITGSEFESRLAIMFEHLGYQVEKTGKIGDFGVDLVIIKDGIRSVVQAKRYKGNVPESSVQEAFSGMNTYHCTAALVVTNSNFTYMARKLAKTNNVTLWDRKDLARYLLLSKGNSV